MLKINVNNGMENENTMDRITRTLQSVRDPIERGLLIIDGLGWLIITLVFFISGIVAFLNPIPFKPLSDGIGLIGISFATLALFLYIMDKLQSRDIDKKRDERLAEIERILKKWDYE